MALRLSPTKPRWRLAFALPGLAALILACGPAGDASNRAAPSSEADGAPDLAIPASPVSSEPASPTSIAPVPLLSGNQLANPGFEEGVDMWSTLRSPSGDVSNWLAFEPVTRLFRSGEQSAYLDVHWDPESKRQRVRVFGVVQDVSPTRFPDTLGGWYRVEAWENPSEDTAMYLQAVVIVMGDPRTQELVYPGTADDHPPLNNYQIRYYLAGLEEPPFQVTNARIKFLGRGDPRLGEWVRFETPVRRDFEELWGVTPADYRFIRVYFEGRWDNKEDTEPLRAEVYYDDVFFGFDPSDG